MMSRAKSSQTETKCSIYAEIVLIKGRNNNDVFHFPDFSDPDCAEMNEINDWLATKQLFLKVIDNKIDFNSYEELAVR